MNSDTSIRVGGFCLVAAAIALGGCGNKSTVTGPLFLAAYGGPAGQVATVVLMVEPGVGQSRTCSAAVDAGSCELTSCMLGGIGSPAHGFGDFGPIDVSVGQETVKLTYGGFGYGTVFFPQSVALGTGGKMRFRGGGSGGVPNFDVSATIPGVGALSAPSAEPDGGATAIDTSQDLQLTWASIPSGQVHLQLSGDNITPGSVATSINCTFDGTTGSGVVPQSLLASMRQQSTAANTYVSFGSELDATTVVSGLTITTQSYQSTDPPIRDLTVLLQ